MATAKKNVPVRRQATASAPAMPSIAANVPASLQGKAHNPDDFKVKRLVTVPQLKLVENVGVFVRIRSAIFTGKDISAPDTQRKMDPPRLVYADNLQTGMPCMFIVNKVVESELTQMYQDNGYVNKCFAIKLFPKEAGKRHKMAEIYEIEDPDAPEAAA